MKKNGTPPFIIHRDVRCVAIFTVEIVKKQFDSSYNLSFIYIYIKKKSKVNHLDRDKSLGLRNLFSLWFQIQAM
jgi:hypothetical protein